MHAIKHFLLCASLLAGTAMGAGCQPAVADVTSVEEGDSENLGWVEEGKECGLF